MCATGGAFAIEGVKGLKAGITIPLPQLAIGFTLSFVAVEAFISCLKLINEAVGDYCFTWGIAADDSGTQRGEFINIVFWGGGCDTQYILPNANAEEVRQHVKDRLAIFAPNGGYVFNQIHNIQRGVPPENIVAMFDAVLK